MNTRSSQVKSNTRPTGSTAATPPQQPQTEQDVELLATPPSRHLSVGTVGGDANPPKRGSKPSLNKEGNATTTTAQPSETKVANKAGAAGKNVTTQKTPNAISTTKTATKSSKKTSSSNTDKNGSTESSPKSMAAIYVEEQKQYQLQQKLSPGSTTTSTEPAISWPECNSKTTKKPASPKGGEGKVVEPKSASASFSPQKRTSTATTNTTTTTKTKATVASTASSTDVQNSQKGDKKPAAVSLAKTAKEATAKSGGAKKTSAVASSKTPSYKTTPAMVNTAATTPVSKATDPQSSKSSSSAEKLKLEPAVTMPTTWERQMGTVASNPPPSSIAKVPAPMDPVKAEILAQEAELKHLVQQQPSRTGGKSLNGLTPTPSEPGAHRIAGHQRQTAQPRPGRTSTSSGSSSRRFAAAPMVKEHSTPELVVAAQLSSEVEAHIEAQVRQRIIHEAVQAEVVSVDHDHATKNMNPDELLAYKEMHKPKGVLEKLFGDSRRAAGTDIDISASPECIRTRDLLKWTLRRNSATNQWVASVHPNQLVLESGDPAELQKAVRSFVAPTQLEAHATGLAMAVPRMLPFSEHPICHVCKAKFGALLRRPCHCRNCGVCICAGCATTWSTKRLAETYRRQNETTATHVNVCIACDWLSSTFRETLEQGRYKAALSLYKTGNINVRMPFYSARNEEVVYPIHVAAVGGNIDIVKWLGGELWCPVREAIKSKRGGKNKEKKADAPLLTSKGRSPLGIALSDQKLDIVHYLIAEKKMSFFEEKDMSNATALANFTTLLRMVPENFFQGKTMERTPVPASATFSSSSSSFSDSMHSVPAKDKNAVSNSSHSCSTTCSSISEGELSNYSRNSL
jgi:hypothetical protein